MDEELLREDQAVKEAWEAAKTVGAHEGPPFYAFLAGWNHGRKYQRSRYERIKELEKLHDEAHNKWQSKRDNVLRLENESAGKSVER